MRMTFMMSLTYRLNNQQRFTSPTSLLSPFLPLCLGACLSATLLGVVGLSAAGVHAQTTVLAPPNYSDLDESNGLYDTSPRTTINPANNAQDSASNNLLETQRPGISGGPAQQPLPQSLQQPQEKNIRNLIRSLGVHSRDVQDTVITHIANEMQFREPMRNASSRLFQAMNKPGMTDAQLGVLLNDCRVAYETDKVRRLDTLEELKAKIGPLLTPRTESMLFLLGLEGDVVITLPTPALLTQSQREQQRLLRVVEGLKLEADSLRRERDDLKAEFQAYQKAIQAGNAGIGGNAKASVLASAQINPNSPPQGFYAPPLNRNEQNLTDEQKEMARLAEENTALKKDIKRLERENSSLSRALKKAENGAENNSSRRDGEKESKAKSDKR